VAVLARNIWGAWPHSKRDSASLQWRSAPQRSPGAEPLVKGQGVKLKHFLFLDAQ